MLSKSTVKDELIRVRIVLAAMFLCLAVVGGWLWRIQVLQNARHESKHVFQSVRRIRIPGGRGRIFDRNGVCLADNRLSYCIALYLEEDALRRPRKGSDRVSRVEDVIAQISAIIGVEPQVTARDIRRHLAELRPLPFLAWRDLSMTAVSRFVESGEIVEGAELYTEANRVYPQGSTAAHVIGYAKKEKLIHQLATRIDADHDHFYLPELVGKAGLERLFDDELKGSAGGVRVRIDVAGFKYGEMELGRRDPTFGRDLILTLDARIQALAESLLGSEPGAIVVLDPRNGDVLALASAPTYDPNDFIPYIPASRWNALNSDPDHPFINRAAAGIYPPASTFKPLVAIAALQSDAFAEPPVYECAGTFDKAGGMSCWKKQGHGRIGLHDALTYSCNVYFFKLAVDCGYDYVYHMADALGIGRKTGIVGVYESGGNLPNDAWKRRRLGEGWRLGDTCNVAIGQGPITATPLQVAVMTAAIANGGDVYRPRLYSASRTRDNRDIQVVRPESRRLAWRPDVVDRVRRGMRDVVHRPDGTGRNAFVPGLSVGGKTGTAEYGPQASRQHHGWMIAFAPFDAPTIAVAIVRDRAISGGITVAPIMRRLLQGIFFELEGGSAPS